jgi:hypothetical protein
LPRERGWFVPYQSGEVSDSQDVIRWPEALDQALQVEPKVPPTILVMKPVVEVESIHVRDDSGHGTPRNMGYELLVILMATPLVYGPA